MIAPRIPDDEAERLASLRSYRILDTEPEEAFDGIVSLASRLLGMPITLVSLVDEARQWFKASHGLDATETSREISFCGHVVGEGRELVVPDAQADVRFEGNPLVLDDPGLRFYAGVPLRSPEGHVLGTLCAIDHVPRAFPEVQLQTLRDLAKHATAQLELRRALRWMAEEQRRTASILHGLHDAVVVQDEGGRVLRSNAAARRLFGLGAGGDAPSTFRARIVNGDQVPLAPSATAAARSLASGEPVRGALVGLHPPDGGLRWLSVNAEPLDATPNAPRAVITSYRDQTEEVEARRALAEERELLHGVLQAMPDASALVFDGALQVLRSFGSSASVLFPDGAEGSSVVGWLPQAQRLAGGGIAHAALLGEAGRLSVKVDEHAFEVRFVPLQAQLGLALVVDVTERDQLQARLHRQERLAAAGAMAAGVGHEINNPLSYVVGNLDFLQSEIADLAGAAPSPRMEQLLEVLDDARHGAGKIRDIVGGLRTFVRDGAEVHPLDLAGALKVSVDMSMHAIRPVCQLHTHFADTPRVLADEAKLSQVLINLLVNAAQAFDPANASANTITLATRVEAETVIISVEDNGPGIADEVFPHIFDPYFTTKEDIDGTGLGLAISQKLVAAFGGRLECSTTPGEGTTFRVVLRREDAPLA